MCDAKYCFTVVDIGANGRQSDGGVFSRSVMGHRFEEGSMGVPPPTKITGTQTILPYVLVADQAFSLSSYLLKPFPNQNNRLQYLQRIFNYRLSSARRVAENSFGIFRIRWQVFWGPISGNPDTVKAIVTACVCLHNFLMKGTEANGRNLYFYPALADTQANDGRIIPGEWRNQMPQPDDISVNENLQESERELCVNSVEMRNRFAEYFEEEGAVPWQFMRMYL